MDNIKDLEAYQINYLWILTLHSLEAKRKVLLAVSPSEE